MTTETHERMLSILREVDELKAKDIALQSEIKVHKDQIANAETELRRCGEEVEAIRDAELRLKRELTDLRDYLFRREEETITLDPSHTPSEEGASGESEGKKLWNDRQRHLKQVQ